jgi:hypothetical protein
MGVKIPTRDEMRAHIEKALRAQCPGDYAKPNNVADPENGPFLVLRGHQGKEVLYYCDSEVASVEFGPASKHFDFSEDEGEDDDIGGPEGFGESVLGQSMGDSEGDDGDDGDEADDGEEAAKGGFSEDDLKALLKGMVQTTLDITQEKVFAAEYKKGFARVARFHSAREYEAVKGMKDFKSLSWKGKYTSG